MLPRKTPLRRTTRLEPRSETKQTESRLYVRDKTRYLSLHPFCQIWLARNEVDEELTLNLWRAAGSPSAWEFRGKRIPRATHIHHRNKRNGARLRDDRWWLSACLEEHDWVENNKDDARALGFLLPIQADRDGKWGTGNVALPTPEFMKSKARRA